MSEKEIASILSFYFPSVSQNALLEFTKLSTYRKVKNRGKVFTPEPEKRLFFLIKNLKLLIKDIRDENFTNYTFESNIINIEDYGILFTVNRQFVLNRTEIYPKASTNEKS